VNSGTAPKPGIAANKVIAPTKIKQQSKLLFLWRGPNLGAVI